MRLKYTLVILIFFLQACSLNGLFPTNAPSPTATTFITYTPIDTPTETQTPLPTASATIVHIPTLDPNGPTPTFPVIAIFTAEGASSPVPFPTAVGPGPGFDSVKVSESKVYWGGCKHNQTVITAEVQDPEEVTFVYIFTRVKAADKEDYTPWTNGNVMYNNGGGIFTYIMVGSEVEGHNHYLRSWVHFQLVATNLKGEEVGRSRIFTDMISLFPCLCLDPTTGCPPTIPAPTRTPKP